MLKFWRDKTTENIRVQLFCCCHSCRYRPEERIWGERFLGDTKINYQQNIYSLLTQVSVDRWHHEWVFLQKILTVKFGWCKDYNATHQKRYKFDNISKFQCLFLKRDFNLWVDSVSNFKRLGDGFLLKKDIYLILRMYQLMCTHWKTCSTILLKINILVIFTP